MCCRSLILVVLLLGVALLGKPAAADETPAPANPAVAAPTAVADEPAAPPQPPPAAPLWTASSVPARRHPALRNTGIVMTVLGGVQLVAGGVLYGLARANCKKDADCGGIPHEVPEVAAGFVMGVGVGAVLIPGIIMWGVGARL